MTIDGLFIIVCIIFKISFCRHYNIVEVVFLYHLHIYDTINCDCTVFFLWYCSDFEINIFVVIWLLLSHCLWHEFHIGERSPINRLSHPISFCTFIAKFMNIHVLMLVYWWRLVLAIVAIFEYLLKCVLTLLTMYYSS